MTKRQKCIDDLFREYDLLSTYERDWLDELRAMTDEEYDAMIKRDEEVEQ